ncbi:hypothetical protein Tco_1304502 [Tanacetum coccineum]
MVEPEPEKKIGIKTQIQLDEELAFKIHAEEQAKAAEKRSKPPTKAQIKNRMCSYLKNMGDDLESDNSKKQKVDEHVEAKGDDDQDEEEMKKHMEIVQDKEVVIDVIPLATKPPVIVEYKIVKEGKIGHFQLIRADGSLKRPVEEYERVLWGDLRVMFELDIKSKVWRSIQGYKVTI